MFRPRSRLQPDALLDRWEKEERPFFRADELLAEVGIEGLREARTRVRQKRLLRVQRGVYTSRKADPSPVFLLAATMGSRQYYVGGDWALYHHDYLDHEPRRLDVFVESRLRLRRLSKSTAVFYVAPLDAFEYGLVRQEWQGVAVPISDPERTFLDALDHPQVFGRLDESLAHLDSLLPDLDHNHLIDYAVRGSKVATCQRLGVLLERLGGVSGVRMGRLMARASTTRSLLSLFLARGRKGQVNSRWRVLENDLDR
jgi:predicted transcriptional regulator of viral defense system